MQMSSLQSFVILKIWFMWFKYSSNGIATPMFDIFSSGLATGWNLCGINKHAKTYGEISCCIVRFLWNHRAPECPLHRGMLGGQSCSAAYTDNAKSLKDWASTFRGPWWAWKVDGFHLQCRGQLTFWIMTRRETRWAEQKKKLVGRRLPLPFSPECCQQGLVDSQPHHRRLKSKSKTQVKSKSCIQSHKRHNSAAK
jgi:hypothetical protein